MHLSKDMLKKMILEKGLLTNYADIEAQLTPNGVDVRLAAIVEIVNGGRLAVAKTDNLAPKLGTAVVLKGFEERLKGYELKEMHVVDSGIVKLDRLKPYLVLTCEELNTPSSLMSHITPRSSLFRLTQSLLGCSFVEAGYKGFLTFMLLPFTDSQIELGSRFAQLSFTELTGEAHYEQQKESNYQGGKLF
ncbi:Deoxycytidine triphosphate deaminase [uncultured archaeon]|nr:Deoxycytidine triphosphate deaminase [uncultured archaeon]